MGKNGDDHKEHPEKNVTGTLTRGEGWMKGSVNNNNSRNKGKSRLHF